jgi:hypothetical protein
LRDHIPEQPLNAFQIGEYGPFQPLQDNMKKLRPASAQEVR